MARARNVWLLLGCAACGDGAALGGGDDGSAGPPAPVADASAGDPGPRADGGRPSQLDDYYEFPCGELRDRTGAATFEAVYVEVFCQRGCTSPYCHGNSGAWADLDFTTIGIAYDALVGQPAGDWTPVDGRRTCRQSELLRVEPYAPERSLLYLKVSGTPPCGEAMPPAEAQSYPLNEAELDQLRRWIEAGAPLSEEAPASP